jgi:hypothetical protein
MVKSDDEEVIRSVEQRIYNTFRGKSTSYRTILKEMADTPYLLEDIEKALRSLRKDKKVEFSGTKPKHDDQIMFS